MLNFARIKRGGRRQPEPSALSTTVTIPAPVGGWNARDALTAMAVTDAIQLDNFIPGTGGNTLREGMSVHSTGLGSFIESLMEYSGPSAAPQLFGAVPTAIYDVTAAGAASSSVTGLLNGRWQHVMFTTPAGSYLVCANGADDVQNYDGSSWAAPAITVATSSNLINVAVHASRLWFVETNTLKAWYLPVASIAGAAAALDLGPFCRLGGSLLAMASWTRDGGSGMDDVLVFVTTKGEAVIYSGTDPSSASTWTKVGTFRIPEPVGRRCFVQIGADLGIITSSGVLPLSGILPLSSAGVAKAAATDKISNAFAEAYVGSSTAFGWQLIEYPKRQLLFVNVPLVERVEAHQYVMNTQIGAWCRFKGFNAGCWALLGDALYFGGHDGTVYKYGGTFEDDGEAIGAVSVSAFTDLGNSHSKIFSMARPMLHASAGYIPLVVLKTDFDAESTTEYAATTSITAGELWDEALWDVAEWAPSTRPSALWQTVQGIGSRVAVVLAVSVTEEVRFNAVDLMYENGGAL